MKSQRTKLPIRRSYVKGELFAAAPVGDLDASRALRAHLPRGGSRLASVPEQTPPSRSETLAVPRLIHADDLPLEVALIHRIAVGGRISHAVTTREIASHVRKAGLWLSEVVAAFLVWAQAGHVRVEAVAGPHPGRACRRADTGPNPAHVMRPAGLFLPGVTAVLVRTSADQKAHTVRRASRRFPFTFELAATQLRTALRLATLFLPPMEAAVRVRSLAGDSPISRAADFVACATGIDTDTGAVDTGPLFSTGLRSDPSQASLFADDPALGERSFGRADRLSELTGVVAGI